MMIWHSHFPHDSREPFTEHTLSKQLISFSGSVMKRMMLREHDLLLCQQFRLKSRELPMRRKLIRVSDSSVYLN